MGKNHPQWDNPMWLIERKKYTKHYAAWLAMKSRIRNYHKDKQHDYFLVNNFDHFCKVLGPAPSGSYSVDRINNSLGYLSTNIRWADKWDQANNRGKQP